MQGVVLLSMETIRSESAHLGEEEGETLTAQMTCPGQGREKGLQDRGLGPSSLQAPNQPRACLRRGQQSLSFQTKSNYSAKWTAS